MPFRSNDLKNDLVRLELLVPEHFDELYAVASDYRIWEQHPEKNRHELEVFKKYFQSAQNAAAAYVIRDRVTSKIIGSSRFYQHNQFFKSIAIGYTFLAVEYWGGIYNRAVKQLMINHAFSLDIEHIIFHVGKYNFRSQKAVLKLGAKLFGESEFESTSNNPVNLEFRLSREDWEKHNKLYE
ncbi:GNAT family N-acetyltransferase [Flavobacterium sp.]|uniref:GNAT family N-acetyltransferase n=1 Tax=Flavobacterium sp. TaxID=239 RepID=UPI00262EB516|nr:GNAT family N-acetyltransferase [Flavobacterium sp.]